MTEQTAPKPKPQTKKQLQETLDYALQVNSYLTSRLSIATALGQSYGGDRNLYSAMGYKSEPTFQNYLNFYERDGIATVAIEKTPSETWRIRPILLEGSADEYDELADQAPLQKDFAKLAQDFGLWEKIVDLDTSLGISRFAIFYLGLPGKPDEPINSKSIKLTYVSVHDEGDVQVDEGSVVNDAEDPRYGLPDFYNVRMDASGDHSVRVHYTRVVHVKEKRDRKNFPRIYGIPRMKKIYNRLEDLEKVVASSSEAFWRLIWQGMALSARNEAEMPEVGTPEYNDLVDEIDEFMHGFKRYMRLINMDVTPLGGTVVSGESQFDMLVTYIAGAMSIPKRILVGSERGELASSQDRSNYADYIRARQSSFAEQSILRPLIARLGELGVLDVPEDYSVYWQSLFELSEEEKAKIALTAAQALNTVSGGASETYMPPDEYAKRYFDYEMPDALVTDAEDRRADEANRRKIALENPNPFNPAGGNGNQPTNEPAKKKENA